jgi:hypothetical protein
MRVKLFLIFKGGIMKKLILAVLMVVMLAVPCMAEVEPEGLFGLEGTFWSGISLEQVGIPIPFGLGFHENTMYFCDSFTPNLACIDFTRASLARVYYLANPSTNNPA